MLTETQENLLYRKIGDTIRKEREKVNYKQVPFAQALNISRASLVNIEKGRQRAPLHILYNISRLLKIEISDLLPDFKALSQLDKEKELELVVDQHSAGNSEFRNKLMEFIKHSSNSNKTNVQ